MVPPKAPHLLVQTRACRLSAWPRHRFYIFAITPWSTEGTWCCSPLAV